MDTNPYHAPTADPFGHSSAVSSGGVTEGVLRQLKGTKGWVKFMAVLCFLAAALMVLLGLLFLGVGIVGGSAAAAAAGDANPLARMGGMLGGVVIGAIYAVLGAIYFYPGIKLWGYASAIEDLLQDRASQTLERALNCQRAFWKFMGVMVIVMISIYILAFVAMLIFGGIMAASGAAAGAGG